jgi:hypothetical protein
MKDLEISVDEILQRFMEAANMRTMQDAASATGVSANSMSGWKARNSVGVAFEYIYPYLLKHDISFYYVFFGIGRKDVKIGELLGGDSVEARLSRLEVLMENLAK